MYFSFESFRSRLIKNLDITPSAFDEGLQAWIINNGDGLSSRNNYLCHVYASYITSIDRTAVSPQERYSQQRFVYGEMYAYKCYHDEDCSAVLKQMHYCDLQLANTGNVLVKAVIRSGRCCPECDKLDNKIYLISEALLLQPLPNPGCTNEDGCICSYGFQTIRDVNNTCLKNEKA